MVLTPSHQCISTNISFRIITVDVMQKKKFKRIDFSAFCKKINFYLSASTNYRSLAPKPTPVP